MTTNPFLANFRPYIADSVKNLRELTIVPLIVGTLLGIVFGASSMYLVLKVGITVSASIPVAVISITLFRVLSKLGMRDATVLEHNIVQTAGSAGESIAFGVGVTMPAIMILGFDLEIWRVTLVAVLGGLLGILMMIPLRRALIRDQHGYLKYPEGTACAEVLKAGANQESRNASIEAATTRADAGITSGGKIIVIGFGLGFLFNTLMQVFKSWKEVPAKEFGKSFEGGSISLENNPALLGVGYIIGPRIAGIMFGGGVLAYLVLIPMIKYFGGGLTEPLPPATLLTIGKMALEGKDSIQTTYILYIGAGAVAAGGMISLFRSLPVIIKGIRSGIADFRGSNKQTVEEVLPRTDRDLSMKWVIGGILTLILIIALVPTLKMNILGAILIILFGFLFVTVSSRLTGEIGSSSNPISGMTVATLLLTCLVFLLIGWTQPDPYFVTALTIGGIVCIAASNGGTTSQDLKTGFIVGATPWKQQIAILTGALASALVLGPILIGLNNAATVYVPVAPTAFATEFRIPSGQLLQEDGQLKTEQVTDKALNDNTAYYIWHNTDVNQGETGRYLVNEQGKPVYLVDPGINGAIRERTDGTTVTKYNAPKATLISYIIKGILSQELPWGLVLLGVMIAIVLEISGIPSLAFAVGLYLPVAVSAPIFVGGMVRWMVDKDLIRKLQGRNLTEEELTAETDKSPGVLLASGYIAGGALAGIMVALATEFLGQIMQTFTKWSEANNPFYAGAQSDWLSLVPFTVLCVLLYYTGRELLFKGKDELR
ncbi:oligopeptide transporter, OPT family [Rhodocytophaga rosea]|uniref:Oligopeptide transporter, OPT family n=1 Tax=Rhodocytophaga rosea TaxID=2704465 RepID=A0A6C0GQ48_9BACT|nr:oligopeptide transporter, OPT family [Rhodocytophaga rosea]QHT69743.1 oligopeptide transporter, OPT family [Rhodocytophaga rosea]